MAKTNTQTEHSATPAANGKPLFRLVESVTKMLPRAEAVKAAEAHQSLPHSPTERELDAKRVKELSDRIKAFRWLPCQWATVQYRGTKFRMNGQHSSQAMLEHPDDLPETVAIHLDHFEAPDAEGMGVLFRQFDARFSARSKQDVSGAYQCLVDGLQGLSRKKAKLGIEGVGWYERVREGMPVASGDDLYQKLLSPAYHGFLKWLDKILVYGKTKELEKAPIIGTMYWTFITSESGAQEFWNHVAKDDLNDDTDPRGVLSKELTAAADPEKRKKGDPFKPVEYHALCVKAWNAFRGGDKIRTLSVNVKKGLPELAA